MTVSTLYAPLDYAGDGTANALAVSWEFWDAADLVVTERTTATGVEVVKTISTHYTVAGGSGSTGTVTPVAVRPSTVSWTIQRAVAMTQGVDLTAGTLFPAVSVENALDRLTEIAQDLEERLDRAIVIPVTDAALTVKLPSAANRASSYLGFDGSGNVTTIAAAASTAGVSAFMVTVLDDTTQAAAKVTLGIPVVGTDAQAWDADLDAIAALAKTAGQVIVGNGAAWLSAVLTALQVSYSPTTSGLVATTVQAAIDERIRTLTKKTSDEADAGTETVVALLSNLSLPGTPNSSRKYRAVGQLLLTTATAGNQIGIARVRVGAAGTIADPLIWEGACYCNAGDAMIPIEVREFTPASGDKFSVTFSSGNYTIRGDATVLESFIEISMI